MGHEIKGDVVCLLEKQTGQSAKGEWQKRDFVIETNDKYPKKIAFSAWGDNVTTVDGLKTGQSVSVSFEPESREWNGRYFTELRAYAIHPSGKQSEAENKPVEKQFDFPDKEDDLPF